MNCKNGYNLDVLIIGGGPAGSAAALTLLKHTSLEIGLIESTEYNETRIGETVSPSILPLLRYLDIEESFLTTRHLPSYSIDSAWGSNELLSNNFIFSWRGHGWHLDRRRFDVMLAYKVKEEGGSLFTSCTLIGEHLDKEKNWKITFARKDGKHISLKARFVIDATGKKATFARKHGTTWKIYDHMIGVAAYYELKSEIDKIMIVESFSDGWWYSAPLPKNKRIVVLMTDSDIAKSYQTTKLSNWNELLDKTRYIKKTINDGNLASGIKLYPAYSRIIKKINPVNWIPTGDSAASFDPIASIGIGHALTSGIQAARVAYNHLSSKNSLLQTYLDDITQNFQYFLKRKKYYYQMERRWSSRPFWSRRQSS